MQAERPVRVSFIVPTLDREPWVNRAVRRCLELERPDLSVQVIVVDSESRDGSWEALNREFGDDDRVKMIQNQRGSGPLPSWIQGAGLATGEYATFIWSDDYPFPNFVDILLPRLLEGAELAWSSGLVRDIETEGPPTPLSTKTATPIASSLALDAFLGNPRAEVGATPVSPACALFPADVLEQWADEIERLSHSSPLAESLLWRRAIGPDLLLFLTALGSALHTGVAAWSEAPVVQFSSHPDSISTSTTSWTLRTGYWTARTAWLSTRPTIAAGLPSVAARASAELVFAGLYFALTVPRSAEALGLSRMEIRRSILGQLKNLVTTVGRNVGRSRLALALALAPAHRLRRLIRS